MITFWNQKSRNAGTPCIYFLTLKSIKGTLGFILEIEQILKISQKTVTFQWILIIFVAFLNVIPFG